MHSISWMVQPRWLDRKCQRENGEPVSWREPVPPNKERTAKKGQLKMTALTRWNPFKEMDELSNHLSSLWGVSPSRFPKGLGADLKTADWSPRVDIVEDENEYLIKADLPAVDKRDVKVTVEDGVLTVSGERKSEKTEENDGKTYHRVERVYGSFTRRFNVPEEVDPTKVKATYNDGVLEVHLPKAPEAKPKSFDIKVG